MTPLKESDVFPICFAGKNEYHIPDGSLHTESSFCRLNLDKSLIKHRPTVPDSITDSANSSESSRVYVQMRQRCKLLLVWHAAQLVSPVRYLSRKSYSCGGLNTEDNCLTYRSI
ncbi:hypothetical protein TNIN_160701 [Trichonephila inaurata madagascariensis]|uniref:Uncharacterized protein n=1 Tax=Trichonephila inaurata madagascariensis TaxID=2747483 RepID=A0A8X6XKS9_9ARAC|nr:hypothetical protein TNIN_160701 [Trichonephila inaurata madagascariensis]